MGILNVLPAAGLAVLCAGANPHDAWGGYTPASNVIEHSQIVLDIEAMANALKKDDFATAKAIYEKGRYSCKTTAKTRTIQGFVNAATVTGKLTGQAFFDSFIAGSQGPSASKGAIPNPGRLGMATSFWDDFMTGALAGTGDFSGKSVDVRKMAVNKGVLGVLTMYVAYELEASINLAVGGKTTDDKGAPHKWDEGWVFFYGSHATPGKYSAWEFTKKRDLDYAYKNNVRVAAAVEGSKEIVKYFREGLKASRSGTVNTTTMIESRNNIYRIFALSSIRAALKYAYKTQKPTYSEKYHMEAYAYYLAAAGWVAQADEAAAKKVLGLLDFTKASTALDANLYCAVKQALVPAYAKLQLDCDMVGVWKDLPTMNCTGFSITCPAAAKALPAGLDAYVPATTTTKGSNVDCGYSLQQASAAPARSLWAAWPILLAGLAGLGL